MPSRVRSEYSSDSDDSSSEEESVHDRPTRRGEKVNYADDDDRDPMGKEEAEEDEAMEDAPDEEEGEDDFFDEEDSDDPPIRKTRRDRKKTDRFSPHPAHHQQRVAVRTSSRATRNTTSMQDPGDEAEFLETLPSPSKTPAMRHSKARMTLKTASRPADDDSARSSSEEDDPLADSSEESEDASEAAAPLRIQRILASRTETKQQWKEIWAKMQTSEITQGSRWYQKDDDDDMDVFEERFLVKWADLSFLHCSWESKDDLEDCTENAKNALQSFFRKSVNGVFYSADERMDGDYFDPAFVQVDRILEVDREVPVEQEDSISIEELGIVTDPRDEGYEDGTGRQLLVKWGSTPYTESTYEFERDLITNDIEYKDQIKDYMRRCRKPKKKAMNVALKDGEKKTRELYKIFGDNHRLREEKREEEIKEFQSSLEARIYRNGGQIRDYQAEGISWMIANYVNDRSSILADEMGLGKTLQTVSTVEYIAKNVSPNGVFLIIAPLSTLTHWQREFRTWTDLNAVVYHGSADNRAFMRENEFAYEEDRPTHVSAGQQFLRRCIKRNAAPEDSPWMVDVVITSPEMLITDDAFELAAIAWEMLIVDEAHRLKNHTSKLSVNLRDTKFRFNHRILLTGTPIQNNVEEFWTLLNFIDEEKFGNREDFAEKYGDMKSSEQMNELHEEIRPYILRRLKEDVEKSVPPKEETLIEVELTLLQKQYYRALYEKNLKFLNKGSKKSDKVGLNNLCMELRKVCNHLFLLNGVEEQFREEQAATSEADFLVNASGKLVLLDKLLPRLQAEGHRILLFSQFKIMLDILEDYFHAREFSFERIDGSITGHKRQQAIDRFQQAPEDGRKPPFIMMLTTKAGGVGITLTAADTCIIFDSDWNPQNDLQAQARCHRIGQTKNVKVYRLLTSKTYEMQMFHMSSLKMGLDQAVLKGFESGSSGESTLSKEEIERLLRHGAYDIFNEEKAGFAEAASKDFVEDDIDSILARRSRKVVHENTGSGSNVAGGTFSKASFKVNKSPGKQTSTDDVDISDPDFWKKMVGDVPESRRDSNILDQPRRRNAANYSEHEQWRAIEQEIPLGSDDDSESDEEEGERARWGGTLPSEWKKEDVEQVLSRVIQRFGYDPTRMHLEGTKKVYPGDEIKRMSWALVLVSLLDAAKNQASSTKRREEKQAEKRLEASKPEGGILGADPPKVPELDESFLQDQKFTLLVQEHSHVVKLALEEAVRFACDAEARPQVVIDRSIYKSSTAEMNATEEELQSLFIQNVWDSLKSRGWKGEIIADGPDAGKRRFSHCGAEYTSIESVLSAASKLYPELANVLDDVDEKVKASHRRTNEYQEAERQKHLQLSIQNVCIADLHSFLEKYAPLQLMVDRKRSQPISVPKRLLTASTFLTDIRNLLERSKSLDLKVHELTQQPHPGWTPRHDWVLLKAVAKHGWIEAEGPYNAITGDPHLEWGAPFDEAGDDAAAGGPSDAVVDHLKNTAERAIDTISRNSSVLESVKGCNFDALARDIGIRKGGVDGNQLGWSVDDSRMRRVLGASSLGASSITTELPNKKTLTRRLKSLVGQQKGKDNVPVQAKKAEVSTPESPYTAIDASDPTNALLIWLIRLSIKATAKTLPQILQLAKQEAKSHVEYTKQRIEATSSDIDDLFKQVQLLENVIKHLDIVRRSKHASALQLKNVLRAIVGDPIKTAKDGSSPFIVEKRKFGLDLSARTKTGAAPTKKTPNKESSSSRTVSTARLPSYTKTLAERALEAGRTRMEKLDEIPAREQVMLVTELEAIMLSALCSVGLPLDLAPTAASPDGTFTWKSFANHLNLVATNHRSKARNVSSRARSMLVRALNPDQPQPDAEGKEAGAPPLPAEEVKVRTERVEKYEAAAKSADETLATLTEYDESALIKKLILLLGKLRKVSLTCIPSEISNVIRLTGPKVLKAFDKSLLKLAEHHGLTEDGAPMAYTAVDFEEKGLVTAIVALDSNGAHSMMAQIALLSQGRKLLSLQKEDKKILPHLDLATEALKNKDESFVEPDGWTSSEFMSSSLNDLLLLRRLLTFGYECIHTCKTEMDLSSASMSNVSFTSIKLSKGAIQLRATQLIRELFAIQYPSVSLSVATGAAEQPKKKKKSITPKASSGQMGLMAFFHKKETKTGKENQVQSDSPVWHDLELAPSFGEKRKDDRKPSADESPEKKTRIA